MSDNLDAQIEAYFDKQQCVLWQSWDLTSKSERARAHEWVKNTITEITSTTIAESLKGEPEKIILPPDKLVRVEDHTPFFTALKNKFLGSDFDRSYIEDNLNDETHKERSQRDA